MTALPQHPCRARCQWVASPSRAQPPRFTCRGCGSQWDRSQGWTPVDADLSVPAGVRDQVALRAGRLTTADGAGGAGSAGRSGSSGS